MSTRTWIPLVAALSLMASLAATKALAASVPAGTVIAFHVERAEADLVEGSVDVHKLRLGRCSGGYVEYRLDEDDVDPVAGYAGVAVGAGQFCTATWFFSSSIVVDGDGTLGPFTAESPTSSAVALIGTNLTATFNNLLPFTTTDGTMPGAPPVLVTTFD